jgi:uncharacterized DUF497 family protein
MQGVKWVWDPQKELKNIEKHGVSFTLASRVFLDPYQLSDVDPYETEERCRTLGLVGTVVLFVVHTMPEVDPLTDEDVGRIISARKATRAEREAYEDG